MGWSIKLGRVAGIAVHMHLTFLLLVFWIGLSHWLRSGTAAAVVTGIAFILALFGCVLLHELGHALTARKYGIKTRDITLLPIGGLARLERMPDDPREELWVALAGPAVNIVIAVILYVWLLLTGGLESVSELNVASGPFAVRLMIVNLFLVGFNLLPAFPMDGGRVLRALLAFRMDYARATQIASGVGQAMALMFGFVGLFGNPFLLFIALFVWIGASQEANMVQMKSALWGVPVARAMQTKFRVLSPSDTLDRAVESVLAGSQQDFPVVDSAGQVVGVLTREDLMVALAQKDTSTSVTEVMRKELRQVDVNDKLEPVFLELGEDECRTLPVLKNGELVGLLTLDNVGEFMMIQSALREKDTAPGQSDVKKVTWNNER